MRPMATSLTSSTDPVAIVLALINEINPDLPTALDLTNVTLGVPQPLGEPSPHANTAIAVNAIAGQGYSETAWVYYARWDVATYFTQGGVETPTLDMDTQDLTSWAAVFDALNAKYHTAFSIYDTPAEVFPSAFFTAALTVTIGPRSLLFTGSFTLTLTTASPFLGDIVVTTELPGLVPPSNTAPI